MGARWNSSPCSRRTCSTTIWKPCGAVPQGPPGADYDWSLQLLARFRRSTRVPTKSGIMLGLGETFEQVEGAH